MSSVKKMPLTEFMKMAPTILGHCTDVKKRNGGKSVRIDFVSATGAVILWVQQRDDALHQIVGFHFVQHEIDSSSTIKATAYCGAELHVRPVMLAEVHKISPPFGQLVARLMQSTVTADGKINHYDLVRGRLTAFMPTAA